MKFGWLVGTYLVAGVVLALAFAGGLLRAMPAPARPAPTSPTPTHYVNLSIVMAPNGWPQYSPANFTVPAGRAVITIVDHDLPNNWAGCSCVVTGTVGQVEYVNGTAERAVSDENVAHTFISAQLGLSVFSPGDSTVSFSVNLAPGVYAWYCVTPCGAGTDPSTSAPMGLPGYMAGHITVS
jgi:hypothetical protein